MPSSKLLLLLVVTIASFSASASADFLDYIFPTIIAEFYQFAPTNEGYRFNLQDPDGNKREEMGVIINPGTPEQQLVVMGTYSVHDPKTDIDTITMYTADKDGYKPRYMLKNRKLSLNALKSAAG